MARVAATRMLLRLVPLLLLTQGIAAAELTLTPIQDNTLSQDNTGYSNGAGPVVFTGAIANGAAVRALLKFDLASLPAQAQITSVQLHFTINRVAIGSGLADPAFLHRLTASWGEGTSSTTGGSGTQATPNDATWSHRFFGGGGVPAQLWTTAGGDYIAAPSSSTTLGGIGAYSFPSAAQLVADVEGWLINPASNHGWILIGPESGDQNARRIHSRESSTTASRPRLVITYQSHGDSGDVPLPLWSLGLLAGGLLLQALRVRRGGNPDLRS